MRASGVSVMGLAVVLTAAGCGEGRVPDFGPNSGRCVPEPRETAGYFVGNEVYLIERAPACRGHSCMVYQWDERAAPDEAERRQFCTCRCDGEGDPSQLCTCPTGYECRTVFRAGGPGLRGGYCVPSELFSAGP